MTVHLPDNPAPPTEPIGSPPPRDVEFLTMVIDRRGGKATVRLHSSGGVPGWVRDAAKGFARQLRMYL